MKMNPLDNLVGLNTPKKQVSTVSTMSINGKSDVNLDMPQKNRGDQIKQDKFAFQVDVGKNGILQALNQPCQPCIDYRECNVKLLLLNIDEGFSIRIGHIRILYRYILYIYILHCMSLQSTQKNDRIWTPDTMMIGKLNARCLKTRPKYAAMIVKCIPAKSTY